jgi:hypothetical protein
VHAKSPEYIAVRDNLISDGIIEMHECGTALMWKTVLVDDGRPEMDLPHSA